jgi:ATP-dependent Clp protease ATP-binding subunit ClpA
MLRHNYIGTEHILLGLLREQEGPAAQALESLGITLERVRAQIVRIVGSGEEVTSGQIPFTPRAKRVLELALREALSLGHNDIGTEHILLGLVRENEGVASRILLEFDADAEKIRKEVIPTLGSDAIGSPSAGSVGGAGSSWLGGLAPVLRVLEVDIGQDLERLPDSGDLLLTLASAPTTRAAATLRAMGLDLDALTREVERVRQNSTPSAAELTEALRRAASARHTAVAAQDYETAAELRDEEKRLRAALTATASIDPTTVAEIRARLGLAPPADPPA